MTQEDIQVLKILLSVHSPSGEEYRMKQCLIELIQGEIPSWSNQPSELKTAGMGDAFYLVFGDPRTIVFAHMDTTGFMSRYQNQLIPIGGPEVENDYKLTGQDHAGYIECLLKIDKEGHLFHDFPRAIARGATLIFRPDLRITKEYVMSPYLDNRLGILNALKVCETLKDGIVAFSCYEEIGGGSVSVLLEDIMAKYAIRQALISDITWITEGVRHGDGVVISIRDQNIPRRPFINKIIDLTLKSGIPFQLEVEAGGASDGREVHHSRFQIDWCFIGAPENNVHSPNETVHLEDFKAMTDLYRFLMKNL